MRPYIYVISALVLCYVNSSCAQSEASEIARIFSACDKASPEFDGCMKRALNKLRPFFKIGIPELGVAPFDPHFAKEVKQVRAIAGMGYTLTLTDVNERGWTTSTVTKYKTDWDNQRIIYSQYFPEKWLEGNYEFKGDAFGLGVLRQGRWNMTLRDYSQTTRIKRNGAGVDVHVEVDHIGDMEIHVGNLLRGRGVLARIFSACDKASPEFDGCMKRALNKLRPFFKIGIPELGVAPFDPHFAKEVKQVRAIAGMGYTLTLTDVNERGWTTSTVTKYKTDWDNQRIIYSQYFPEKWLEGNYEFKGDAFGLGVLRQGRWNMTLRDYSQTTRIKRNGAGVDVHVEVDHIGDMEIHVGNLLRGRGVLESVLDRIINATWKPGFAVIRPLINDLVSTAFTDIWSKSFQNFPLDNFIK